MRQRYRTVEGVAEAEDLPALRRPGASATAFRVVSHIRWHGGALRGDTSQIRLFVGVLTGGANADQARGHHGRPGAVTSGCTGAGPPSASTHSDAYLQKQCRSPLVHPDVEAFLSIHSGPPMHGCLAKCMTQLYSVFHEAAMVITRHTSMPSLFRDSRDVHFSKIGWQCKAIRQG